MGKELISRRRDVLSFLGMKLLFFLILFTSTLQLSVASELRPFSTDYCTNYPEGTRSQPNLWKHCCLIHDLNFWAGGSFKNRNAADLELRSCIELTGAVTTARLMYWAVRVGSVSPLKYPDKRWGNGWPQRRINLPLSIEEIERIESELAEDQSLPDLIKNDFLRSLYLRLD